MKTKRTSCKKFVRFLILTLFTFSTKHGILFPESLEEMRNRKEEAARLSDDPNDRDRERSCPL